MLTTTSLEFNNAEWINQSPRFSHLLDSTFWRRHLRKGYNQAREHRFESEFLLLLDVTDLVNPYNEPHLDDIPGCLTEYCAGTLYLNMH